MKKRIKNLSIILLVLAMSFALYFCGGAENVQEPNIETLTQLTADEGYECFPAFSRDGGKIAFSSNKNGNFELWDVPTQGGTIKGQLTSGLKESYDIRAQYSPDGKYIVYESTKNNKNSQICLIEVETNKQSVITSLPNGASSPKWFPDSKKIVYVAYDKEDNSSIWMMEINGSNAKQICAGKDPVVSPDGNYIAYSAEKQETYNIWTNKVDGSSPSQITLEDRNTGFHAFQPEFSPDGKRIAYVRQDSKSTIIQIDNNGKNAFSTAKSQIFIYDFDKKQTFQVTFNGKINCHPSWSGKPNYLAFTSDRSGVSADVWMAKLGADFVAVESPKEEPKALPLPKEGDANWFFVKSEIQLDKKGKKTKVGKPAITYPTKKDQKEMMKDMDKSDKKDFQKTLKQFKVKKNTITVLVNTCVEFFLKNQSKAEVTFINDPSITALELIANVKILPEYKGSVRIAFRTAGTFKFKYGEQEITVEVTK